MLNNNKERELAYVCKVEEIEPIPGYDRVEYARIGAGWWCVVKKNDFKPNDLCVYFEIDSKLPAIPMFEFCSKYNYRVKTQKLCKVLSQGLIMSLKDLNLEDKVKEGDFLTKQLGVTYYDPEDNARKTDNSAIISMQARHKKFFQTKFAKWFMKRKWGRKLMFFFLGKKKDKKTDWPKWVVKTDEERCQNMPQLFENEKLQATSWIATEKIDGTSTTFTMKQGKKGKRKMLVCSRNIVFNSPEKSDRNFYKDTDGNVYIEMAVKYRVEDNLNKILDMHPQWDYITIQGETYGGTIQKRNYGSEHRMAIFNIIYAENGKAPVRMNPIEMHKFLTELSLLFENSNQPDTETYYYLQGVPIVDSNFILPKTCEELLAIAGGESQIDKGMREGLVFRSDDGKLSFKAVDNRFLEKYHG